MAQMLIDRSLLNRMAADHEMRVKKGEIPDSFMVLEFKGVEIPKEFFFFPEEAPLEINAQEYDTAHKETTKAVRKVQQGLDKEARLRAELNEQIAEAVKAGRTVVLKSA